MKNFRKSVLLIVPSCLLSPFAGFAQGGSVDAGFATGAGADDIVNAVALQSNGKLLIGGYFTEYDGVAIGSIARLNSDGTQDNSLSTGTGFDNAVQAIVVQPDGKIIVGGIFSEYNGVARPGLVRLNSTGSVDATFSTTGVLGNINTIALQSDGKILIGGSAVAVVGGFTANMARLNLNGGIDNTFDVDPGPNGTALMNAVQPDGRILAGGYFTAYHGTTPMYIARVETNGTKDANFQGGAGTSAVVRSISVQPDGKIIIAGSFTLYNGTTTTRVGRLLASGAIDTGFNVGSGANSIVHTTTVQPDGKVFIGGLFTTYNGAARSRIARLNANGTVDNTFNIGTGANDVVRAIAVQADGKVVVGGGFSAFNGTARGRIVRLHALSPVVTGTVNSTACPGSNINVPFSINSAFQAGNVFTAQLSNASGSFTAPVNIGSLTGTTAGSIPATIPAGTAPGSAYRVRVVGSLPLAYATDNGANITVSPVVTYYADGDADGLGDPATTTSGCTAPNGFVADNTDLCPLLNGTAGTACNDGNAATVNDAINANCQCLGLLAGVRISAKILLDGPFVSGTGLMNDDLRAAGLVPVVEPYTALGYVHTSGGGGEAAAAVVFAAQGNNAVVDWVLLELRNGAGLQQVVATRSALVQRDGDVVDIDGLSPVAFAAAAGSYALAVKHRNHLGMMTAGQVAMNSTPIVIDFTATATSTYGTAARKTVGSKQVLWAGDATGNGILAYTGTNNDRDPILTAIGGAVPTLAITNTYARTDTNMDGAIKYTGTGNDRDVILVNVGGAVPTAVRVAQIP